MTGSYTPGPWGVHDHRDMNGAWWIGPGPFDTIGEVRHGHDEIEGDELANARLISAAPELLEALVWLLGEYVDPETTEETMKVAGWSGSVINGVFKARAAIAKATSPGGEQ